MMMTRRLVIALALLLSGPAAAAASPIVFTDRSQFEAAAQPNHDFTFNATGRDCTFTDGASCAHTFDDLLTVIYDNAGIGLLGDAIGLGQWSGQSSTARFESPVVAIGFDLIGIHPPPRPPFDSTPSSTAFHFAGSTFETEGASFGLPLFFGAIFDDPTTSIPAFATMSYPTAHGVPTGFLVTNMSVTRVPEASLSLLLSAGVVLVLCGRLVFR